MKILITGLNGTVAPVLARHLARDGHDVTGWDRTRVPVDDPAALDALLDRERPAFFFHVALGPADWAEAIARACAGRDIPLLFTSTVSVFAFRPRDGEPLRVDAVPDAADDYGRYKADCETRIRASGARATIVRIGWQIGSAPGSNNMVDYLHKQAQAATAGHLELSRNWLPACSFLDDTAACLCRQFTQLEPGTYHLDGNPGLSLYDIATGLNRLHGWGWTIRPADHPDQSNPMADERLRVRPITERLEQA